MAVSGLVVDQLLFELRRGQLAETRVGSNLVVVTPELLDDKLRIDLISESLHVQALIAELAVERLVAAVLPRFPWINMGGVDVGLCQPLQNCS